MSDLACYLINLDRSTERLKQASSEAQRLQLSFERISAVDGRYLELDACAEYSNARTLTYFGRELSVGEVACFLSHVKTLRQFLQSDAKYALVLEDDFVVSETGQPVWDSLIAQLDEKHLGGWGYIDVGAPPHKLYSPVLPLVGDGNWLVRSHYFSFGTHALLWSRSGAERLLQSCLPIEAPYDIFLRGWNAQMDVGYAMFEPPFSVSGMDSDIEAITNRAFPQRRWSQIRRRIVEKPMVYRNMASFRVQKLLANR